MLTPTEKQFRVGVLDFITSRWAGARRRGKERNAMLDPMVIPDRGETRRKGETKWMCTLPSAGMYADVLKLHSTTP